MLYIQGRICGRRWFSVAVLLLSFLLMVLVAKLVAATSYAQEDALQAAPLGTEFTYQGQLKSNGTPYTGTCDLRFYLWDSLSGGAQIGAPQTKSNVNLADGHFTVQLDFGSGVFQGNDRWLAAEVRCPAGAGVYTALSPRKPLTPTPYALALPGLWTQPNATSPNLIGGFSGNTIMAGVEGATIGGGGRSGATNQVTDVYSTIGGGANNQAGNKGGSSWDAQFSTVGGGDRNTASGEYATVGGGSTNTASQLDSTVAGGSHNDANGPRSSVGGGYGNEASGEFAIVGGGHHNTATGNWATVAGGGPTDVNDANTANFATDNYSTIGGGGQNLAGTNNNDPNDAEYATVAGGEHNEAGRHAAVGGGASNQATGTSSTISGGWLNTASGSWATVPGGSGNSAGGTGSFAAGHWANANNQGCFVWGDFTESDLVTCSEPNRTLFRSSGGFYIYTNAAMTTGVYLSAGSNGWQPLEAPGSGESETSLNMQDPNNVALATIEELYTQNEELKVQNAAQQAQIDELAARVAALETRSAPTSGLPFGWLALSGLIIVGGTVSSWRRFSGDKQ
jgi:hypothetical protein